MPDPRLVKLVAMELPYDFERAAEDWRQSIDATMQRDIAESVNGLRDWLVDVITWREELIAQLTQELEWASRDRTNMAAVIMALRERAVIRRLSWRQRLKGRI